MQETIGIKNTLNPVLGQCDPLSQHFPETQKTQPHTVFAEAKVIKEDFAAGEQLG